MGYFDGIADGSFKKNDRGQIVFYANGIFGKGYILDSPGKHMEIREFVKKMYMVLLVGVILLQVLLGFKANLVFGAIWTAVFYFKIKEMTKDLPTTTEKLKMSEARENSARSHNLPTLIVLEVFSALFLIAGLFMITEEPIMAVLSVAFGSVGTYIIGKMILIKLKEKNG